MAEDKLGTYITKLMTTVIDKNQDDFVKDLAMSELQRLNVNISDFIRTTLDSKNKETLERERKQEEKQLLQEDTNGN
tara:strand:+ start:333 stop:563 length:231 start_codon:yes stop_codon:yes gene_type:complete